MAGRWRRLVWLTLVGLPLSTVINLWVKRPLAVAVGDAAGVPSGQGLATPVWFLAFLFLPAPVLEETIKLLPLAVVALRRRLAEPGAALWAGMYWASVSGWARWPTWPGASPSIRPSLVTPSGTSADSLGSA